MRATGLLDLPSDPPSSELLKVYGQNMKRRRRTDVWIRWSSKVSKSRALLAVFTLVAVDVKDSRILTSTSTFNLTPS